MKLSRPLKRRPADRSAELVDVGRRMAPQLAGPPAHIHAAHDETFVVLEGQLRFRIGDQFHTAVPGETVFASRRLAHGFSNPFDDTARYIAMLTPSGYEDYFTKVAEHIARIGAMPDLDQTRDLMAQHDTVLAPRMSDVV
ncbi:MAG: cupin domain-containing protein [Pseudonocardiaceae bacterium]